MTEPRTWKHKLDLLIQVLIGIDLLALAVIFLHTQFGIEFPFPVPGNKLNNPLVFLLAGLSGRAGVNPRFRDTWRVRLQTLVTATPHRYYLFAGLLAMQGFLQAMWLRYPEIPFWNLNMEQGYGTHFSTLQLFLLGLVVLITGSRVCGPGAPRTVQVPWILVAGVYLFLGLDDCVGIHENLIQWSQQIGAKDSLFHFIHEWLWFYAPFIAIVVVILVRFFLRQFQEDLGVMLLMFLGLGLWISVLLLEGLAKNVVDPMGLSYGRLLISFEEGAEMLGATLFLFGFSQYLRNFEARKIPAAPTKTETPPA